MRLSTRFQGNSSYLPERLRFICSVVERISINFEPSHTVFGEPSTNATIINECAQVVRHIGHLFQRYLTEPGHCPWVQVVDPKTYQQGLGDVCLRPKLFESFVFGRQSSPPFTYQDIKVCIPLPSEVHYFIIYG